jgi:hypothetical protein
LTFGASLECKIEASSTQKKNLLRVKQNGVETNRMELARPKLIFVYLSVLTMDTEVFAGFPRWKPPMHNGVIMQGLSNKTSSKKSLELQ